MMRARNFQVFMGAFLKNEMANCWLRAAKLPNQRNYWQLVLNLEIRVIAASNRKARPFCTRWPNMQWRALTCNLRCNAYLKILRALPPFLICASAAEKRGKNP